MTTYIALLRGVNVGGAGRLTMAELTAICIEAGFARARTYIASGNVVFESDDAPASVKAELEERLRAVAGKAIRVILRSAAGMQGVLEGNPFPQAPPAQTVAIFLDAPPPADALARTEGAAQEEMRLGPREIYVYYPLGLARSKLKIPAASHGTARNMNTIAKLVAMAGEG